MEDETDKIFKDQLRKLPKEVLSFILSSNWEEGADEIGSAHNLSHDEIAAFKREIELVLVGLTHPDEFSEVLGREVGIEGETLAAITKEVEDKIFASVRPLLVAFLEKEEAESIQEAAPITPVITRNEVIEDLNTPVIPPTITPARMWEKEPDVAPENLPTGTETEPLFPPIPEKTPNFGASLPSQQTSWTGPSEGGEPTHPFEDKMKKVFTAGQQSMGDFVIEPVPTPEPSIPNSKFLNQQIHVLDAVPTSTSTPPPVHHVDPYREPIE